MENLDVLGLGGGIFAILIGLFIILLSILWLVLPFAVFGIKERLDRIARELKESNEHLSILRAGSISQVAEAQRAE